MRHGRPFRWLAKRLGLAAISLLLTVLALEVLARLLWSLPPPRLATPGHYVGPLPLVNGRLDGRWAGQPSPDAPALQEAKRPDELRVVTFGESSMEGCPWGAAASPAAFLATSLQDRLPERPVTVINMGKTSSFVLDTYYYLLAARHHRPDFVVFYQGENDRFDLDAEMCAVLSAPRLHATWRWFAARSRLLWLVRVFGPELFLSLARGQDDGLGRSRHGAPNRCDPHRAFAAWTRVLTDTAAEMGARMIIVSYTASDLEVVQQLLRRGTRPNDELRRILACPLDPTCRLSALMARLREPPRDPVSRWLQALFARGELPPGGVKAAVVARRRERARKNEQWRIAAAGHNAVFLDFDALVRELPGEGAWLPPVFVDGVHLSVAGYAILGDQMAQAIATDLAGEAVPPEGYFRPSGLLSAWYEETATRTRDVVAECDLLLAHGELYAASGHELFAGHNLPAAREACPPERLVPHWERYRAFVDAR